MTAAAPPIPAPITTAPLSTAAQAPEAPVSLEQLRDLQLPDAVGLWPPAPGWWLLAVLSLGVLFWLGRTLYRRWRTNRYRKQALRELTQLGQSELRQQQPQQWLQQLNQLLRRTALTAYPPQAVAPLSGTAWVDFLYQTSQLEGFRQGAGVCLADGPYQPLRQDSLDSDTLQRLARQWIRTHKRGAHDAEAAPQPLARQLIRTDKREVLDAEAARQPLTRQPIRTEKQGVLDADA